MPENTNDNLGTFCSDLIHGLQQPQKRIPCKYFYDERGCELFEEICELDEYYLTRTELSIMRRAAGEMASHVGSHCVLIELGSGAGMKTRILLDHLDRPAAYVPVDIAHDHLQESQQSLSDRYDALKFVPVCADFTGDFVLPEVVGQARRKVVYFPGSTIGNFEPPEAAKLLTRIASLCERGGGLLIGMDLQKDAQIIEAAYDDAKGITAEFNLNLLRRANREAGGNFELNQFRHVACYDQSIGRIEMYLESLIDQEVAVANRTFSFAQGERILTEYSHKYVIGEFAELAAECGFELIWTWTDDQEYFGILFFETR